MLLGGKLVAALVGTREIRDAFARKYTGVRGVISGQGKPRFRAGTTHADSIASTRFDFISTVTETHGKDDDMRYEETVKQGRNGNSVQASNDCLGWMLSRRGRCTGTIASGH
jgi:hypothetical protein